VFGRFWQKSRLLLSTPSLRSPAVSGRTAAEFPPLRLVEHIDFQPHLKEQPMTESRTKLVIEISRGIVRNVFCDQHGVEITIVDWDTEDCSPGSRYLHRISGDEQRTAQALVYLQETTCPEALENTDTLKALEAAGKAKWS